MGTIHIMMLAVMLIGCISSMVAYVVISPQAKGESSVARSAEMFGLASEVSCMGYIPFAVRLRLAMTKPGETVAMPGVWAFSSSVPRS